MEINVSQLLKAPVGSTRDFEVDETIEILGSESEIGGQVRLMRTGRGILASGSLHTEVEAICSRCLASFSCPLAFSFEEEYYPTIDVNTGAPLAVPDEPGCFTINENHILDLTEAMRQYAILAIPMKPLCRDDCAGLCPICGQDLNYTTCDCLSREIDPRWAKLKELISGE